MSIKCQAAGSDFINHTIFGDDDIYMLVVRFDGDLGDDLLFKGQSNFAGGDPD